MRGHPLLLEGQRDLAQAVTGCVTEKTDRGTWEVVRDQVTQPDGTFPRGATVWKA